MDYLITFILGTVAIGIGNWLSLLPLFLLGAIYETVIKPNEKDRKRGTFYMNRVANGITIGLLHTILVTYNFKTLLLLAIYTAFVLFIAEGLWLPEKEYIYAEICEHNYKRYKSLTLKFKLIRLITYGLTMATLNY
jgi:hypothetical protein